MRIRLTPFLVSVCLLTALHAARAQSDNPHGNLEPDCTTCHDPEAWTPARVDGTFDHAVTGFVLQGSHASTKCAACHVSLRFVEVGSACVSCHQDVHQNELGGDCERCHTARSFIDRAAMVRTHLTTRFPLRGAHRVTDCEDCHVPVGQGALQYVNTSPECRGCHLDSYLATTSPDHQDAGFPESCEACHTARGWTPAGFNHNLLAAGVACSSCHLGDYLSAEPDHQAAGFPDTCEICHGTRAWTPLRADGLNHDGLFFPIFSGRHNGRWQACSDCHTVLDNFAAFECLQCHEHDDPVGLADKHDGVAGYAYESQACYACHPQGVE
jgi:hypothetical protein